MASLYKKVINGRPYWYLREMGWVDGKPQMISERYLGTAAEIEALLDARQAAAMPDRSPAPGVRGRRRCLGDAPGTGGRRDHRRSGRAAPRGRRRLGGHLPGAGGAEPAGRAVLETRVRGLVEDNRRGPVHQDRCRVLDHRRFWDVMHAVTLEQLERASEQIAARIVQVSGVDVSSVALDMTNFATSIATSNGKAPIARSGARPSRNAPTCGWWGWGW